MKRRRELICWYVAWDAKTGQVRERQFREVERHEDSPIEQPRRVSRGSVTQPQGKLL